MFRVWADLLPKHRALKKHDRVCERHFLKEDIITSWEHVINGVVTTLEREKPMLKSNAIPQLNLPDDTQVLKRRKEINRMPRKKVKEEQEGIQIISIPVDENNQIILNDLMTIGNPEPEETAPKITEEELQIDPSFESLFDEIFEIELPSIQWGIHRDLDQRSIAFSKYETKKLSTTKVLILNCDLEYKIILDSIIYKGGKLDTASTENVSKILEEIEAMETE
jgi:hypothetical protein